MKIHIVTVGKPKLPYAQQGFQEYLLRLKHYHDVRVTHLLDKNNDAKHITEAIGNTYKICLEIRGTQMTSVELSQFLEKRALEGREVCFVIGGPDGLPNEITAGCDYAWSFSKLTFPHDLAMVVLSEALYRASTISAGQPYHR